MSESVRRERIAYMDVARGVSILLVVLGHAVIPAIRAASPAMQEAWNVTYAFHITPFFLIAGFCYEWSQGTGERTPWGGYALTRARRLLLPYLVYSLLIYGVVDIAASIPAFQGMLGKTGFSFVPPLTALMEIVRIEPNIDGHLWFLPCLFFVSVFSHALGRQGKKWYTLLLALAVNLLPVTFGPLEYFRTALGYTVAYTLGRMLVDCREKALSGGWPRVAAFAGAFVLCYWLRGTAPFNIGLSNPLARSLYALLSFLAALSGGMAVLLLGRRAEHCSGLARLGKLAFPIYLFHQPFFTSGAAGVLFTLLGWPIFVTVPVAGAVGLGLGLAVYALVRKSRVLSLLLLGQR